MLVRITKNLVSRTLFVNGQVPTLWEPKKGETLLLFSDLSFYHERTFKIVVVVVENRIGRTWIDEADDLLVISSEGSKRRKR